MAGGAVLAMAVQADGKILVGGGFSTLGGQLRSCLGRLNPDGSLDTSFNPVVERDGQVYVRSLLIQQDGKIVVGGWFSTVGGQPRANLARLNVDGTLDSAFNPGACCAVCSLLLLPNDKILVGGTFWELAGQPCGGIGRLNPDGSLDTGFDPVGGADGTVYSMAVQPDGKLLVAGSFKTLAGQPRNNLGRLDAEGSLDSEFDPKPNGPVYALMVQPEGQILVAGWFDWLAGDGRTKLARLNADGTRDPDFHPTPASVGNPSVHCLALQADGKILIGGEFSSIDGKPRVSLARLNADGTVDDEFNPGSGSQVFSLAVQADGKTLVGGTFTTLGGQTRSCLGRLNNTEPATEHLDNDGSTITWRRGGTSPEVSGTIFEASTNGMAWTSLGSGTHMAGGWRLTGVSALPNAIVRALGFVTGGHYNGSSWFVEGLWRGFSQAPPAIRTTDNDFGFTSNQFGFNIVGTAGQVVVVEGSTNLCQWTPLGTNTLGPIPLHFNQSDSWQAGRAFYRVRLW